MADLPIGWPSAKGEVVAARGKVAGRRDRMTWDQVAQTAKELERLEQRRRDALSNQTTPDWARSATLGFQTKIGQGPKQKVGVMSKHMQVNDY
jgi:hypothetical protein